MVESTYRCSSCLKQTIDRDFDVSHVSISCSVCEEPTRFVNGNVYEQFQAFEESPPESLNWGGLSRVEKFLVSNQIVRKGRSINDFEIAES